jgi:hypothetical protein
MNSEIKFIKAEELPQFYWFKKDLPEGERTDIAGRNKSGKYCLCPIICGNKIYFRARFSADDLYWKLHLTKTKDAKYEKTMMDSYYRSEDKLIFEKQYPFIQKEGILYKTVFVDGKGIVLEYL